MAGGFEQPKTSPSFDKIEWLEHWATPSGTKWARMRAIASLGGRNKAVSIETDFRERYLRYLRE
jgi:hypothetical protein